MRVLKFIVNGQSIKKDPKCDFSGLVPGTDGYLKAEISFSSEWDGYVKAAGFYSMLGEEYRSYVLADGKTCKIPAEALKRRAFKIKIVGKRKDGPKLTTNKVTVSQNGGKT